MIKFRENKPFKIIYTSISFIVSTLMIALFLKWLNGTTLGNGIFFGFMFTCILHMVYLIHKFMTLAINGIR